MKVFFFFLNDSILLLTDILETNIKICQYLLKFPILEIKSQKSLHFYFIFSFSVFLFFLWQTFMYEKSPRWRRRASPELGPCEWGSQNKNQSRSFCQSKMAARQAGIWLFISWLIMAIFHKLSCCCNSLGLCPLVFSFALYFWWMGSHPWFFFTRFFFMEESSKTLGSIVGSSIGGSLVEVRHILRPTFIYWRFIGGSYTYT